MSVVYRWSLLRVLRWLRSCMAGLLLPRWNKWSQLWLLNQSLKPSQVHRVKHRDTRAGNLYKKPARAFFRKFFFLLVNRMRLPVLHDGFYKNLCEITSAFESRNLTCFTYTFLARVSVLLVSCLQYVLHYNPIVSHLVTCNIGRIIQMIFGQFTCWPV